MLIDFKDQTLMQRYRLMAQTVIPRPIAWIVTEDEVVNIAPFSYFMALSSQPPTLIVSIGQRDDGTPKDTLRNLRNTGKCVICMVGEKHFEAMHLSSKELESHRSEAEVFGIRTKKILEGYPPMAEGVQAAFFCDYLQEVDLEGSETIPVIVEIKQLYIDDHIINDPKKLSLKLDAIARIGKSYAKIGEEITPPPIP
ncbi:MAG: flavin reductase family protein [Campylobacterales bacterium]|nr:flavin reductase family protein [Campylobacterales bacterium]